MTKHNILFISGLHRSGTTLLAKYLGQHHEISDLTGTNAVMDEGQFLQSVYPIAKEFGGPGKFGFDERAHLKEVEGEERHHLAKELFNSWKPYWEEEAKYFLEKSPPNLLKTRFLSSLFPDARFITLTRHPLAVSLATQKWSRTSIDSLMKHWFHCHQIWNEDKKQLNAPILELRYEDLATDEVRKQLQVFLDVKLDELENYKDQNNKYSMKWRSWRYGLIRKKIEEKFESQAGEFGYSIVDF